MSPAEPELDHALESLSRRRLIQVSVFGAAALAACTPARSRSAAGGLDGTERAVFTQLIAVMLPTGGLGLARPETVPVMENIERVVGRLAPAVRKDFGAGLLLFEHGAYLIGWNFARFTRLTPEAATDYCRRWESGAAVQRALFGALKQIVCMSYWREPATWPAIGYEGPVSHRFGLPRLGNAPLPQD